MLTNNQKISEAKQSIIELGDFIEFSKLNDKVKSPYGKEESNHALVKLSKSIKTLVDDISINTVESVENAEKEKCND